MATSTSAGTLTVPIFARWNGKEYSIADLTMEVEMVDGRIKLPSVEEIVALIREAR